MLTKWLQAIAIAIAAAAAFASPALAQQTTPHSFAVKNGHFELDGKPFQIISGEIHYQRVPRVYWRERFRMAKAMGLNAVTTYVFWNVHEQQPGTYDFSGNNDVAEFIREAQQEGLYVVLRPGPYVCAEWEFGGYPAWLLKDHSLVLRSNDPKYIEPAARWFKRLGQELAPLQVGNGGPIILVQVENEYGSFGNDHAYMEKIRSMLVDAGFTKSQLYTADGAEEVPAGSLPDLPVGINFGGADAGAAQKEFAILKKVRPNGPFFNSEYWDGWFDHWGGPHASTNATNEANNLDWMLKQGYSVSLYMFHGGTSFGWMNGANSDGKNYEPDVTSYDYDSPLDESGRPSPKFSLFREVIAKDTGKGSTGRARRRTGHEDSSVQAGRNRRAVEGAAGSSAFAATTEHGRFGPGIWLHSLSHALERSDQRKSRSRRAARLCAGVSRRKARGYAGSPPRSKAAFRRGTGCRRATRHPGGEYRAD